MTKFSIVTCISNKKIYNECILESLKKCRYSHDIEIIPIINTNNIYHASNAYNYAMKCATSNNLIFAHQDVEFVGDWFSKLDEIINSLDSWGAIGCSGISLNAGIADIGVWGGYREQQVAVGTVYGSKSDKPDWDGIKDITKVHCLDECLFIVNRLSDQKFDENIHGFHFYGADLCLQLRDSGYDIYAADLPIIHYGKYSTSMADKSYWRSFKYVHNKWCEKFNVLLGTHMHWNRDVVVSYIQYKIKGFDNLSIKLDAMGVKF